MTPKTGLTRSALLSGIADTYAALGGTGDGPDFIDRFYRHVALDELAARNTDTLAGAAAAHRALAQDRVPGVAKVRVFNPTTDADGWTSPRTVVQIVTDDMPFLVDSVTGAIVNQGRDIHLLVHPQFVVSRNAVGDLERVEDAEPHPGARVTAAGRCHESWMLLTIDRETDEGARAALESTIRRVLQDVREAVEDWPKMRTRCLVLAAELEGSPPSTVDIEDVRRSITFLRWMADDHFTFLGYREYRLDPVASARSTDSTDSVDADAAAGGPGEGGQDGGEHQGGGDAAEGEVVAPQPGTGLGLLRDDPPMGEAREVLTPWARDLAHAKRVLVITKANSRSTVHRTAFLDYVGVREFDAAGEVIGERRFLGLYSSTAYTDSVTRIPLVKDKCTEVLARSGVAVDSHTGKDLMGVLETYPRDELLQASADQLYETAMAVTQLQERRRTKLFLREDEFRRYVSCLVYIPRDRYNTAVRVKMADILKRTFEGEGVEFTARVSESALSRLQFVVRMPKGQRVRQLNPQEMVALEHQLVEVSRTWTDRLGDALRTTRGEVDGNRLFDRFGRGFPTAYEETFTTSQGLADLSHLDRLGEQLRTSVALYRPPTAAPEIRRFKLFRVDPLSLTDVLPIFTHMGVEVVDEQPFEVSRADGEVLEVYDFGMRVKDSAIWEAMPHEELRRLFEGAVLAVWQGEAESDGFNQLVLGARLTWRQIVILRTIAKYLRQTQTAFSQDYFEDALISNPQIAAALVHLFETRFDPDAFTDPRVGPQERAAGEEAIAVEILAALDVVSSLDHDRIIRAFLAVIRAGLRTNFYQRGPGGTGHRPYVSLKVNPTAIPDLPAPRPAFEIWVYSPRVEGVHLRFGAVARGGLRWSDRREDFRTEILGLVKAQMVKNAVIVPTGSKGGFYPKALPDPSDSREAWLEEGKAAYRLFISGLLDLTDNRVASAIVPPERVVRHDGDDPYLVVAADKGTATFSDIANAVAQSYGFWLDDAFASGGSAGYDHKGMGITARGAWESVKRHFRELGVDTQSQEFTVVGIGDMSGDVFGNGMLLSPHIRLVAAFDHRHIFVDPHPVAATSFAERSRIFALPRSSWEDYDRALISAGGGVFARSSKSIAVGPEMIEVLGLKKGTTSLTPAELMKAILQAPVDLLWNGGIGTYVKASTEDNLAVGDRANDAIRITGSQLRVKVVGEGGNLGCSQLGRIEAALAGIRINTDAIDNSAGVDTSDHEVNIKILLGEVVRSGRLTLEERNAFLASMTDEVGELVLRDNYEQNVLLGNARAQEHQMVTVHERLMKWLEARGDLDRSLEFLPSDGELVKRAHDGLGLKSPEFSVLVAYAKLALKHDLLATDVPDDPWFGQTLAAYFPTRMREAYADDLATHPLRREIVTNALANSLVNRGGITFAFRAIEETGASAEQVARAFVICREIFDLAGYVRRVEALDNQVPTTVQTRLYLEMRRLLDRAVRWFLTARPGQLDIQAEVARFSTVVRAMGPSIPDLLRGEERKRLDRQRAELEKAKVPADLAAHAASLLDWYSLLDIVDIATDTSRDPAAVAPLYYLVSERFGIDTMLSKVTRLPREDRWDALARGALRDDLYAVLESLTRAVLEVGGADGGGQATALYERWARANAEAISRTKSSMTGILRLDSPNIAALSVALRTLRSVVRSGSASPPI